MSRRADHPAQALTHNLPLDFSGGALLAEELAEELTEELTEELAEATQESTPAHQAQPSNDSTPERKLLDHPDLWRAGQLSQRLPTEPSTFAQLDAHLPGGGWPLGSVTELLLSQSGIGELQLLMPALAALSQRQRWVLWINPPFVPYAPALESHGVDTRKVLLIHTRRGLDESSDLERRRKAHQQALWALEKASRSGTCSAALAWFDERLLKARDIQRLQVAAAQGQTLTCLFRPAEAQQSPSMAPLRLQLSGQQSRHADAQQQLSVHIAKRRGGWAVPNLSIELNPPVPRPTPSQVQNQLELWRAGQGRSISEQPKLWPTTGAPAHVSQEQVH